MTTVTHAEIVNGDRITREEFIALAHAQGFGHLLKPEPHLPVGTLTEAIPYLRRPFSPASVKWKVQSSWPKDEPRAGQVIAYIDARLVIERLNLVCPGLWSERFELFSTGQGGSSTLWCHLTIDGVTHSDVGEGKGKALVSDARKRVGVAFGIGVSLYAIPAVRMFAGDGPGKLPVRGAPGKRTLRIEVEQLEFLRSRYEAWLETPAGKTFGDPLDHGDALGAAGDPFDPDAPEQEELTEALFDDEQPPRATGRKISAARVEKITALAAGMQPDHLLALLREVTGKQRSSDWLELLRGLKGEQADEVEQRIADGSGVGA